MFQGKQIVWWFLVIPVSVETCSLARGKNFNQVWKSCMKSESQGKCTCAQCCRIAPVPVSPVSPSPQALLSLAVFSHPGKAQGPAVLKVTELWLFVSGGQFVVQGVKAFRLFLQIPGKKNKLRVYYLSWLRNKILRNDPEVEKRQGWVSVGDLEGCVHYKVGKDFLFFP